MARNYVLIVFLWTGMYGHAFAGLTDSALIKQGSDVVLEATLINVKSIGPGAVVDAIEKGSEGIPPTAVAVFKIDRVVKGEFTKLKEGGPTKFEQSKEALHEGNVLKIATFDLIDPAEEIDKGWFSVAVADLAKTLDFRLGENVASAKKYKIFLDRVKDQPDSFIMVNAEPM